MNFIFSKRGRSGIGLLLILLIVFVVVIVVFVANKAPDQDTSEEVMMGEETVMEMKDAEVMEDEMMMEMSEDDKAMMMEIEFEWEGNLDDVSESGASGVAKAVFKDGVYSLMTTFENLPDPESFGEGYFYEGWVVQRDPLDVISSGVVSFENGTGENVYMSETDLTDHDFYVLTIEPDDGDPAPADHILEGVLMRK